MNTKKISKSDASAEMQAALAKMTLHNLLVTYPGELIRFFVLSTQYRRPIEYSEQEIESKRKALDTFYRLFERVERTCGQSPYDSALTEPRALARADIQSQSLATACDECVTAFARAMDDDFNTAGAIASLFDLAAAINRFIEQEKLEGADPQASGRADSGSAAPTRDVLVATGHLISTARLIGLFLEPAEKGDAAGDDLTEEAMQVLIKVRRHLRRKKDFETADLIRDLLAEAKITLEDRADGTTWRQG
jgi:cysteinyl-tRNA synthetase